MKKYILLSIIMCIIALEGCNESEPYPAAITFNFKIIDSLGNDLFFEKTSQFNPYDVKFGINQDSTKISQQIFGILDSLNFQMVFWRIDNEPIEFYIQFISERVDTFLFSKTQSAMTKYGYYEYDVMVNSKPICLDCKIYEIYKINIDE